MTFLLHRPHVAAYVPCQFSYLSSLSRPYPLSALLLLLSLLLRSRAAVEGEGTQFELNTMRSSHQSKFNPAVLKILIFCIFLPLSDTPLCFFYGKKASYVCRTRVWLSWCWGWFTYIRAMCACMWTPRYCTMRRGEGMMKAVEGEGYVVGLV
ncbi:hypothetical protein IWZ03DRAFT_209742 [Phyllosticta citriasiana]|uniref:Uncharacterized protein n=1 Tax=Phyllosticta citriasiana TaxID=595635 RepID=A0ABR1KIZ3_9PEZI